MNTRSSIRTWMVLPFLTSLAWGCTDEDPIYVVGGPAAPRNFDAFYYDHAVHLSWELAPDWDGEVFRVWGRRVSDSDYFFIAEVTSCSAGECRYTDPNVFAGVTYEYYVSAVDDFGDEAASAEAVEVFVPEPIPPPVPEGLDAVPLDGAVYLVWDANGRDADDFSFYRVYLEGGDGSVILLGDTDSEGFLDTLVENGNTYGYFVTSVDVEGHESDGGFLSEGTPRPDYRGELLYAYEDRPGSSGFQFQADEGFDPVLSGDDGSRDLRIEFDADGWWLVPAPGVQIADESYFTTALRCGPGADAGCIDVRFAPASGYAAQAAALVPEYAYVLRIPDAGGGWRHAVVRVSHLGFDQGDALVIFDWAHQIQPDNPALQQGPDR